MHDRAYDMAKPPYLNLFWPEIFFCKDLKSFLKNIVYLNDARYTPTIRRLIKF